jgi:hypothetical protein
MADADFNVQDDPRWKAFNAQGLKCSCGETHVGLFPINMLTPAGWQGPKDYQPDDAVTTDGTFISENYCVFEGKAFAIRMRLPLRIRGAAPAAFTYTVWGAVNKTQFESYVAARKASALQNGLQSPATLCNRIGGYEDTFNLTGIAFQQNDGYPPMLLIMGPQQFSKPDHELIAAQKNGIDFDKALAMFAEYGHDMRTAVANTN